jgi:hypothetical protein
LGTQAGGLCHEKSRLGVENELAPLRQRAQLVEHKFFEEVVSHDANAGEELTQSREWGAQPPRLQFDAPRGEPFGG